MRCEKTGAMRMNPATRETRNETTRETVRNDGDIPMCMYVCIYVRQKRGTAMRRA